VENEQIRGEMDALKRELENSLTEKEDLNSQINSLKNKIKSLQAENDKFLVLKPTSPLDTPNNLRTSKISSPPLSHKSSECESEIPSVISARMFSFEDPAKEREKIQTLEEENKQLREQNKKITQSLEM
jgi:cell division septum initiation protein DivIVA